MTAVQPPATHGIRSGPVAVHKTRDGLVLIRPGGRFKAAFHLGPPHQGQNGGLSVVTRLLIPGTGTACA